MSVFEQTVVYKEMTTSYLKSMLKREQGFKKRSSILERTEEQILLSEDMLESLRKQRTPQNKPEFKTALTGMKGFINKYIKVLQSVVHGIETNTLPYSKLINVIDTKAKPAIQSFSGHVSQFVHDNLDDKKIKDEMSKISRQKGFTEALKHFKEVERRKKEESKQIQEKATKQLEHVKDKALRKQLSSFSKYAAKLPTNLNGRLFDLIRMPIIPYMSYELLSRSFLKKTDIEPVFVDNYFVVFQNQVLLAFDMKVLKQEYIKAVPKGKNISPQKAKANKQILASKSEELVLDAIEKINKVSNTKYVLASSKFAANPHKTNIYFAWLLPAQTHRLFVQRSSRNEFLNVEWGFPWGEDLTRPL